MEIYLQGVRTNKKSGSLNELAINTFSSFLWKETFSVKTYIYNNFVTGLENRAISTNKSSSNFVDYKLQVEISQ